MLAYRLIRRCALSAIVVTTIAVACPSAVQAQGFISPAVAYNFGGDAGCLTATDCEDKNWTWGVSGGALGSIVGFEIEWTYSPDFIGETRTDSAEVTTLMANFMLAPRISIVQPYGLVGLGMIRTEVSDDLGTDSSENQIGWTIGGGLMVFLHRHFALKGDVRYYHSLEALDFVDIDVELARDENKVDFGRAAFGVVFAF